MLHLNRLTLLAIELTDCLTLKKHSIPQLIYNIIKPTTNTLIICISDHSVVGYPKGITQNDRNRNHIPLLLLGGAVKEARKIETLCNQQDLVATILPQLGLSGKEFPFSRNILSPGYDYPFAYHCFNNGFSIIDSTGFTVYSLDNGKTTHDEPEEGEAERLNNAKATLQTTYSDFIRK